MSQAWRFGCRMIVALNIQAFGMRKVLMELMYYSRKKSLSDESNSYTCKCDF